MNNRLCIDKVLTKIISYLRLIKNSTNPRFGFTDILMGHPRCWHEFTIILLLYSILNIIVIGRESVLSHTMTLQLLMLLFNGLMVCIHIKTYLSLLLVSLMLLIFIVIFSKYYGGFLGSVQSCPSLLCVLLSVRLALNSSHYTNPIEP